MRSVRQTRGGKEKERSKDGANLAEDSVGSAVDEEDGSDDPQGVPKDPAPGRLSTGSNDGAASQPKGANVAGPIPLSATLVTLPLATSNASGRLPFVASSSSLSMNIDANSRGSSNVSSSSSSSSNLSSSSSSSSGLSGNLPNMRNGLLVIGASNLFSRLLVPRKSMFTEVELSRLWNESIDEDGEIDMIGYLTKLRFAIPTFAPTSEERQVASGQLILLGNYSADFVPSAGLQDEIQAVGLLLQAKAVPNLSVGAVNESKDRSGEHRAPHAQIPKLHDFLEQFRKLIVNLRIKSVDDNRREFIRKMNQILSVSATWLSTRDIYGVELVTSQLDETTKAAVMLRKSAEGPFATYEEFTRFLISQSDQTEIDGEGPAVALRSIRPLHEISDINRFCRDLRNVLGDMALVDDRAVVLMYIVKGRLTEAFLDKFVTFTNSQHFSRFAFGSLNPLLAKRMTVPPSDFVAALVEFAAYNAGTTQVLTADPNAERLVHKIVREPVVEPDDSDARGSKRQRTTDRRPPTSERGGRTESPVAAAPSVVNKQMGNDLGSTCTFCTHRYNVKVVGHSVATCNLKERAENAERGAAVGLPSALSKPKEDKKPGETAKAVSFTTAGAKGSCYNCQKPGHISRDCPEKKGGKTGRIQGRHGRHETRDHPSGVDVESMSERERPSERSKTSSMSLAKDKEVAEKQASETRGFRQKESKESERTDRTEDALIAKPTAEHKEVIDEYVSVWLKRNAQGVTMPPVCLCTVVVDGNPVGESTDGCGVEHASAEGSASSPTGKGSRDRRERRKRKVRLNATCESPFLSLPLFSFRALTRVVTAHAGKTSSKGQGGCGGGALLSDVYPNNLGFLANLMPKQGVETRRPQPSRVSSNHARTLKLGKRRIASTRRKGVKPRLWNLPKWIRRYLSKIEKNHKKVIRRELNHDFGKDLGGADFVEGPREVVDDPVSVVSKPTASVAQSCGSGCQGSCGDAVSELRGGKESSLPSETGAPTAIMAPLTVKGHRVFALVDSGSTKSAIRIGLAREWGLTLTPETKKAKSFDGALIAIPFTTQLEFTYRGCAFTHPMDVCELSHDLYFGLDIFSKLSIRLSNVAVSHEEFLAQDRMPSLPSTSIDMMTDARAEAEGETIFFEPEEYYDMEDGGANAYLSSLWRPVASIPPLDKARLEEAIVGEKARNERIPLGEFCNDPDSEISLHIKEGEKHQYRKQYGVDVKVSAAIGEQVEKWMDAGIVVPAPYMHENGWNSPILGVSKKDAITGERTDVRVCMDFRAINTVLDEPSYDNVPLVHELYQRVEGKKYFSALDLKWSYHQFKIKDEDQLKTTFTWERKRLMFKGAPFGIKHLTSRMQALMSKVLQDCYGFTIIFVDDVIICSDTLEDHIKHVKIVLDLLTKVNLKLNIDKCHFGFTCIQALGHLITGDSRFPEPSKLQRMQKWVIPTTGKQMMSFLGFTNYLRDYIPLYASIVAPLEPLRRCKVIGPNEWTEECGQAFDTLRSVLRSPPVIQAALPNVPLVVACDASQYGVGAVLYQETKDASGVPHRRYIEFASRALNSGQKNYSATRRELLAIIFALQRFRYHLATVKFELLTDHRALTFMFSQEHVNYMLANWLDVLLDYDFTITHCPGVLNVLPDSLSRMYPAYVRIRSFCQPDGSLGLKKGVSDASASAEYGGTSKTDVDLRASRDPAVWDKYIQSVDDWVTHPDRELKDFILHRLDKVDPGVEKRVELVSRYHLAAGHESGEATFKKLWYDGFYWPNMKRECTEASLGCLSCLRWNVGKTGYHPMKAITSHEPFAHIAIDLADFTHMRSVEGHCFMLVVVDIFSKFTFLVPLKDKTAFTVARELFKIGNLVGHYRILQSDNGTEFVNVVSREYNRLLGSEHRRISAYNPAANGVAENAVGNMKLILMKLLGGAVTQWHLFASTVQYAMNTRTTAISKSCPFSVLFGRKVDSIVDIDEVIPEGEEQPPPPVVPVSTFEGFATAHSHNVLLERSRLMLELIYPELDKSILSKKEKMQKNARKLRRELKQAYALKSKVMVIDKFRKSKSQPRYLGPYTIVGHDARNNGYRLVGADKLLYPRTVPADHLKPIVGTTATVEHDGELSAYEVECVRGHRMGDRGEVEYLVKWRDYDNEVNSYVPFSSFIDIDCIINYWKNSAILFDKEEKLAEVPPWARVHVLAAQKEVATSGVLLPPVAEGHPVPGQQVEATIRRSDLGPAALNEEQESELDGPALDGQEMDIPQEEDSRVLDESRVSDEIGVVAASPWSPVERMHPARLSRGLAIGKLTGLDLSKSSSLGPEPPHVLRIAGSLTHGRRPTGENALASVRQLGVLDSAKEAGTPVQKPLHGPRALVSVDEPSEIERAKAKRWDSQISPDELVLAERTRGKKRPHDSFP